MTTEALSTTRSSTVPAITDAHPSASFSAMLRVHLKNHPGSFAALANAIASAGGLLGAIDLVRVGEDEKVRDVGPGFFPEPLAVVVQEAPRDRAPGAQLGLHNVSRQHHAEEFVGVVRATRGLED